MNKFNETTNYHYGNQSYDNYRLNVENIESLLKHKYEFDPTEISELLNIYIDLFVIIEKCNLNNQQKQLVNYLCQGCSYNEVAEKFNYYTKRQDYNGNLIEHPDYHKIQSMVKKTCRKIYQYYQQLYQDWLEINGYVRIPIDIKYKMCNKCKRDLRTDYFYPDDRNYDGLRGYCKYCD